ncbi:MAG: DUF1918 domain-containing protein [Pseudonocardiaceae bacterium]
MTAHIGDKVMIMSQLLHQPMRAGAIRGVRDDPGGTAYLVQWSDTGYVSLLRPRPDVVTNHPHGREPVSAMAVPWLARLRHPLAWLHSRDLESRDHVRNELLAWRVQGIIARLGLTHTDFIGGDPIVHVPQVVSIVAGPPVGVNVHTLPGQTPDEFAAHAPAIAYSLGVDRVRVIPLGHSRIRLDLLTRDPPPRASTAESVTTSRRTPPGSRR